MEISLNKTRCYCDACGKLIYEKDRAKPVAVPTDFYEIRFDHYDANLSMGGSREPSGVYHRVACSESCIYKTILPVYFSKVSAKKKHLQNTEGIAIRHRGFV